MCVYKIIVYCSINQQLSKNRNIYMETKNFDDRGVSFPNLLLKIYGTNYENKKYDSIISST